MPGTGGTPNLTEGPWSPNWRDLVPGTGGTPNLTGHRRGAQRKLFGGGGAAFTTPCAFNTGPIKNQSRALPFGPPKLNSVPLAKSNLKTTLP